MLKKFLDTLRIEGPILPNSFTVKLGQLIRDARLEAKMSQEELADQTYLKQSSISKIEKGMRAVSSEELLYLMFALNKPIIYFFPKEFTQEFGEEELTVLEKELIIQSRQMNMDDLRKLIAQARAIAELKPSHQRTDQPSAEFREFFETTFGKQTKRPQKNKKK